MLTQKPLTKKDQILAAWKRLGFDSVGASEIAAIQAELTMESPASIARVLADQGYRLRHPEVLDSDVRWRERNNHGLFRPEELNFDSPHHAIGSVLKITELAEILVFEEDTAGRKQLESLVIALRRELQELNRSPVAPPSTSALAGEVSEWLLVWLQNAALFQDWFELRLKSADFIEKFGRVTDV